VVSGKIDGFIVLYAAAFGGIGDRDLSKAGSSVDNRTPAAAQHCRRLMFDTEKDGGQIDPQGAFPLFQTEFGEGNVALLYTGIVERPVEPTIMYESFRHQLLDGRFRLEISFKVDGLAASFADAFRDSFTSSLVDIAHHQSRAMFSKDCAGCRANPPATACHEDHLSIEHLLHQPSSLHE